MKKFIVHIAQYYKDKFRRRIRRRLLLFGFCLLSAATIWLLNVLGKRYQFEVDVSLVYDNIPKDKALKINNRKNVLLTVEGSGWYFLRSRIDVINTPIRIDFSKLEGQSEIDLYKNITEFNKQIQENVKIVDIFPRKVHFSFGKKAIKKVPIQLDIKISYDNQYMADGPILISPDSVVVTGPQNVIEKITRVFTTKVTAENINKSMVYETNLVNPGDDINLSSNKVILNIPVDKFTEGEVVVPVQTASYIYDGNLKLYPSLCTVRYQVNLSDYHLVKPQDFRVITQNDLFDLNKLKLLIVDTPSYVRFARTYPSHVDYLISK